MRWRKLLPFTQSCRINTLFRVYETVLGHPQKVIKPDFLKLPSSFLFGCLFFCLLSLAPASQAKAWGFWAHKVINRMAVFTLPPEMSNFYKLNSPYLMNASLNPDRRRQVVKGEGCRHFFDVDAYGSDALSMPLFFDSAAARLGTDSLLRNGIAPYHLMKLKSALTTAFSERDTPNILRLSSEIGHYLSDICVPLHTTRNYNGQLTGQKGIHALWESQIPEMYGPEWNLFSGTATYLESPGLFFMQTVQNSFGKVDSVLNIDRLLRSQFSASTLLAFKNRNGKNVKTYSREYVEAYYQALHKMPERQMRKAIQAVGSLWYTCWVDAGQPDLNLLVKRRLSVKQKQDSEKETVEWKLRKTASEAAERQCE